MPDKRIDLVLAAAIAVLLVAIVGLAVTAVPGESTSESEQTGASAERQQTETSTIRPIEVPQPRLEPTIPSASSTPSSATADASTTEAETAEEAARPIPSDAQAGPLQRMSFALVDEDGTTGACGIALEPWRHVAVSRDLLEAYGCGAELTLVFDDDRAGRERATVVIADTMNPSHSRTINIFVSPDDDALRHGVLAGEFEVP